MHITLYDYFRSSAAYRVRIALNIKNIRYDKHPIHLLNNGGEQHLATYKSINPQELLPTLVIDGQVITQSLAILEYLEECYPEPALLPKDPILKAKIRAVANIIACDIHPINNLRVLNYLKQDLHISEENTLKWYEHWIVKGLESIEILIKPYVGDYFCFGNTPTLADICLIPQVYNALRFHIDISKYPRIQAIFAHANQLESFIKAYPNEI